MITIKFEDRTVLDALSRLQRKTSDLSPLMHEIGEYLTETTKRRFDTSTAPDGTRWAQNSPMTIRQSMGKTSKARTGIKKPLISGRSGMQSSMMATINYNAGRDFVEIGSPKEFAAMQHFGGQKSKFPHLWGDIPARPFLGISDQDHRSILDTISDYLNRSVRP